MTDGIDVLCTNKRRTVSVEWHSYNYSANETMQNAFYLLKFSAITQNPFMSMATKPLTPDATSTQTHSQSTEATEMRNAASETTSDVFTSKNDTSYIPTFQSSQTTDVSKSSDDFYMPTFQNLQTGSTDSSSTQSSTNVYSSSEKTFCDRNLIIRKRLYSMVAGLLFDLQNLFSAEFYVFRFCNFI